MTTFYTNLNRFRRPDESDRKFSLRLGHKPPVFLGWKRGSIPKWETLEKLASILDVKPEDLMKERGN
jgi:hypothetical protein